MFVARFPRRPTKASTLERGARYGSRVVVSVTRGKALMACDCGAPAAHVRVRVLVAGKAQRCPSCAKHGPAPRSSALAAGDTFGLRTVLSITGQLCHVRCACGREDTVRARYLLNGTSRSCSSCANPLRGIPIRNRPRGAA